MVVSVLLRHRTRPGRLRHHTARLREAHLADRLAELGLRRRHVRAQRGGLRQPGPRRHRDPQLPLAARPGRGRAAVRRAGSSGWPQGPAIAVPTITLEGDANGAPHADPSAYAKQFSGPMRTGSSPAASATTCRKKPPRPSPRRSSTSTASKQTPARHGQIGRTQPCRRSTTPLRRRDAHGRRRVRRDTSMAGPTAGSTASGKARPAMSALPSSSAQTVPAGDDNAIRPFHVDVPEATLVDLRQRVAATSWPEQETVADESQGVQLATMQKLARYWATDYDWRKVRGEAERPAAVHHRRSTGSTFTSSTSARSIRTRCR